MAGLPLARSGRRSALGPNAESLGGLRHRPLGRGVRVSIDSRRSGIYKEGAPAKSRTDVMDRRTGISDLLRAWGRGDLQARDDLVPLVYQELRRQAARYLRRERADHTLEPT